MNALLKAKNLSGRSTTYSMGLGALLVCFTPGLGADYLARGLLWVRAQEMCPESFEGQTLGSRGALS